MHKYNGNYAHLKKPEAIAKAFVQQRLQVAEVDISSCVSDAGRPFDHVYFQQRMQDIEIVNADIAVHLNKKGVIIAHSSNAYKGHASSVRWPELSIRDMIIQQQEALVKFSDHIHRPITRERIGVRRLPIMDGNAATFEVTGVLYAFGAVRSKQVYIQSNHGVLQPAWEFVINTGINYFKAHLSLDGKRVLNVIDWAWTASYSAVPVGFSHVVESGGLRLMTSPHLPDASHRGWHRAGREEKQTTMGNNAVVTIDADEATNQRRLAPISTTQDFRFTYDGRDPDPRANAMASITNVFYVINMMHDIFYRYGFNEPAGNYQQNNFKRGGLGGDAIVAESQVGWEEDNAFFIAREDGVNGLLGLGLYTVNGRKYDLGFDNDVIIHEVTHGLSSRLVGGPAKADCLNAPDSRGMGEGWSDFVAIWTRMKGDDRDDREFRVGTYATPDGLRDYPYALDKHRNPLTYGSIYRDKQWQDEHDIGIVWANILYQMYRNIYHAMDGRFSTDFTTASIEHSNTYTMQIIIDSMQLMPCNPTFIHGRDALIAADAERSDGKYKCEIYTAFAKWGVGAKAKRRKFTLPLMSKLVESNSLPRDCKDYAHLIHAPTTGGFRGRKK
ncbi:Fungalysin metallopeptidase-domain-containing protein [Syncephalis pseudoplumigaleata]|uniref:Extracellular metalloproteinase n=1 Tax=Syncephalis pseudoplumigaleata TaxID=1712513 RepID=A0A4P9Z4J7_9FUNG|nr:Fungalysin metallopeptidase-domain-containing protein [Syncephalis pseudoplumigaleata]|eukprot:RKP26771.1 Fungalysin metallopeptidase-domain-containing protein [Syncephalis pseudoplumigaleata]